MNRRPRLLIWHGAVVALLCAGFVAGGGFGLIGLVALGLPWNLPVLSDPDRFSHWPLAAHFALWLGPVFFNVGIHAAVTAAVRRRKPPSDRPVSATQRRMNRWPWSLIWHGAVVVLLLATFVVMVVTTPEDAGANIGAGMVAEPLLVLGLPWTLPVLVDPDQFFHWSTAAHYALWFGPALLNIGIHAAVRAAVRRRHSRA